MKITPKVSLLKSLRGERVNRLALFGEAIDNSFDANAGRVEIRISDQTMTFRDDGIGLDDERLAALFTLGDHVQSATTALGRYGIGITAQVVNAANILEIDSVSLRGHCKLRADWHQVLRSGEWEIPDPSWLPIAVGTPTHTLIALSGLRTPEPYTAQRMFDDMAEFFHHGLQDGKQIVIDGQAVQFVEDPPIDDVIERDLILSGGRSIKLRAGILRPGRSRRWGVYVGYRHRVLKARCNWGCGDYVGLNKMFCRLRLGGPWRLAKFKDDLSDQEERDELEAAVSAALHPILEKVNGSAMDARINALGELINQMVPPDLAAARPHRKKKGERDENEEKEKRKRKQNNETEQNDEKGPARTKRPQQGRLMITFDGRDDDDGIGNYQPGRPDRVNLAKDNLIIGRIIAQRDQQLAASALYVIAMLLYESRSRQFELFDKSLGKRVADLLVLNIGMLPQAAIEPGTA